MVDITCTRCGAEGTNYPTPYVAKFSLQHNTGCGARIGIPKFSLTPKAKPAEALETALAEPKEAKPKKAKKKAKKV